MWSMGRMRHRPNELPFAGWWVQWDKESCIRRASPGKYGWISSRKKTLLCLIIQLGIFVPKFAVGRILKFYQQRFSTIGPRSVRVLSRLLCNHAEFSHCVLLSSDLYRVGQKTAPLTAQFFSSSYWCIFLKWNETHFTKMSLEFMRINSSRSLLNIYCKLAQSYNAAIS